jgi:hypothetical protein
MSRGSPRVCIRLQPDLLAAVQSALSRANESRREEAYDLTSWITHAIQQKLDHLRRSQRRPPRRRRSPIEALDADEDLASDTSV